ncbi:MAG TPA: SUMF1/EgtB/PvdO family nonheme iron enzyme [Candidatus Eremiobacteraceae bacterium]|nr:SUMF1/EgtB/PvdO family nonheme iron enzyme [Candidatus Eremiobacteraceae bacterium]
MQNVLSPTLERADLLDWYRRNRERSLQLFDMIDPDAYYSKPIPLRHPIVFYEGHLPAFSFITLARNALGRPSIDAQLEKLFQRGIDPADEKAAAAHAVAAWPSRQEVRAFGRACDEAIVLAMLEMRGAHSGDLPVQAAYTILEHEQMHHETLLYIYHQLPYHLKHRPANGAPPPDATPPQYARAKVPAGSATLGARRGETFGWDNEFEQTVVEVPAFEIDAHSVTNADYLAFVKAGGPVPSFWSEKDGRWLLQCMFEEVPLPASWPVYVTHEHAAAFAEWKGMRLPTEAEFHRAAFGTPSGGERAYPWGAEPPSYAHGNFNFHTWDPEPAGSHPAGASAWRVHDLVGNGWEWTASTFRPLPGFAPMQTYPQYSADFFDEQHYVVKGASAVTARELIRRSFRNWYRPNYPYVYAKFRCVA